MQHILAVLDRRHVDSVAFQAALVWSKKTGAKLSVFLPADFSGPEGLELGPGLLATVEHTLQLQAERWLEDFLSRESQAIGRHAVASAHWVEAVRHEVERLAPDLMFIHRDSAPTASAWKKLLRQLPAPVCIVRDASPPVAILAAVSAVPEDAAHQVLNDTVLNYATQWRELWSATLTVASALPNPLDMAPLMGEAYVAAYVGEEMAQSLRAQLLKLLEKHQLPADVLASRTGMVESVLAQTIDDCHANWVVMGTVGRHALAAWFAGNSAERIERRLPVNLLLLRPQDYQDH